MDSMNKYHKDGNSTKNDVEIPNVAYFPTPDIL